MKVAVLYSGHPRGNWIKNSTSHENHFRKYDKFYSTWTNQVSNMPPGLEYKTYKEPEIKYNCITDTPKESLTPKLRGNRARALKEKGYRERVFHQTKQILNMAYMLQDLPEEYDMIIRIRYDTHLSYRVDFTPWLEKSYEESCAVGFGTRWTRHKDYNLLTEVEKHYPPRISKEVKITKEEFKAIFAVDGSQDWGWYLMDPLIFFPRKIFDIDRVFQYNEEKKLLPAENGWYQILSEPYGDNHHCVYGGVQIEKYFGKFHQQYWGKT